MSIRQQRICCLGCIILFDTLVWSVLTWPQEPTGPTNTSQFEHSSISATITNLFHLSRDKDTALGPVPGFLTQRDAWAGSFHELLTLDAPRTDCPMHLPTPPVPATPFPGGMCDNLLHADCGSNETKSDPSKCAACIEKYRPNLLRAGCQAGTLDAYCKPKWQRSSSITDDRRRLSEAGAAAPQHGCPRLNMAHVKPCRRLVEHLLHAAGPAYHCLH